MKRANEEIRRKARAAGIPLWRVADRLHVSEGTLIRWLRVPLDREKDWRIRAAVCELEREAEGGR